MKRVSLTFALLCAACAFVYAGPESIMSSGKEMKEVVPVATPCPSWTGFYVGGFAGYKYGDVDTSLDLGGSWDELSEATQEVESNSDPDLSTSGAELGGLIGFNYQWHNWVFGAEAAGGYLWLRDSENHQYFVAGDKIEADFKTSTSFKTHYLATFGGKLGYAVCRWLPYVTGGLAVGDLEYDQTLADINNEFPFRQVGSKTETNCGWFVGGGLEYMITNHWRVRGQYQYIDLGSTSFHTSDNFDEGFTGRHSVDLKEHNAQFALIYGF